MAVRTRMAGTKNPRRMTSVDEAQTNRQATNGKKTVPRDQAAALRRQKLMRKATPGPAMTEPVGHGPATTEVRPTQRTVTRRKMKRGNAR
ncbi:hypothetical protein D187_002532 [Cystobacter fuscus DSM 2262]|uniref:Uncharacterized protein n=1 Tax=Cystobacter fuscus (strain ATCC 25194 / DSM 2262 / NBRC 100088 / M29) TaxID=1242864 RepID=S9QT18_CYSF2|nr:hypothetical protein [Cystobacter fuscus]EPX59788.1 hypothetical protein D187_002532 [Cystobacter fuscus DSM 2262]